MNWIKGIAPYAYATGLIAYVLWLIMIISQVKSEGFSVFFAIAIVLAVFGIGYSFNGLRTTLK